VISSVSKKEGKAGILTVFSFPVTLSSTALSPVTITYATANGTALASTNLVVGDYLSTSGTLTFPTGTSTATIKVTVIGNNVKEPNETFYVKISNPSANAYLGDTQATGTILNDD
jgi:endoglucanase